MVVPEGGDNGAQARRVDETAYDLMARVAAYWADQLKRNERVLTYATTKRGQLVELPPLDRVTTGDLKLKTTSAKAVKIEGIGVSRV